MRKFNKYGPENDATVKEALGRLADESTQVGDYRDAFFKIGVELGKVVRLSLPDDYLDSSFLACASEDADWLAKGVLAGMEAPELPMAVFWTKRVHLNDGIDISPIFKSYQDDLQGPCKSLVIVKSIISSSCVVKTQILRLISSLSPERIIVVAPVMYKDSEAKLKKEFPKSISDRFEFVTFAIDDEIKDNVIVPGIGGWVYPRLGFYSEESKNSYIPQVVMERMAMY